MSDTDGEKEGKENQKKEDEWSSAGRSSGEAKTKLKHDDREKKHRKESHQRFVHRRECVRKLFEKDKISS